MCEIIVPLHSLVCLTQYDKYNKSLVYHQGVRFHWRRGIVQRVGVLRGFALQLTLVGEGTSTTITEESARRNGKRKWLANVPSNDNEAQLIFSLFI